MKGTHKINIEELHKQGFWINPAYGGLFIEDTQTGTTFYFNQETGTVTSLTSQQTEALTLNNYLEDTTE